MKGEYGTFLEEGVVAEEALVWSFARVLLLVDGQRVGLVERLAADVTHEGTLACNKHLPS